MSFPAEATCPDLDLSAQCQVKCLDWNQKCTNVCPPDSECQLACGLGELMKRKSSHLHLQLKSLDRLSQQLSVLRKLPKWLQWLWCTRVRRRRNMRRSRIRSKFNFMRRGSPVSLLKMHNPVCTWRCRVLFNLQPRVWYWARRLSMSRRVSKRVSLSRVWLCRLYRHH